MINTPNVQLSLGDRLRKRKPLAPFIILIDYLILKCVIRDGWQGWLYAFQRVYAELLLSLRLMEADYFD